MKLFRYYIVKQCVYILHIQCLHNTSACILITLNLYTDYIHIVREIRISNKATIRLSFSYAKLRLFKI